MMIVLFGILLTLVVGAGLAAKAFSLGSSVDTQKKWESKSKELPADAIVVHGQWYRRVYGFDSKLCGHPQYAYYYIALNQVDGRWVDGEHSANLFPLEAFDDRKNGVHECKEHIQYSSRGAQYCYVCGREVAPVALTPSS